MWIITREYNIIMPSEIFINNIDSVELVSLSHTFAPLERLWTFYH